MVLYYHIIDFITFIRKWFWSWLVDWKSLNLHLEVYKWTCGYIVVLWYLWGCSGCTARVVTRMARNARRSLGQLEFERGCGSLQFSVEGCGVQPISICRNFVSTPGPVTGWSQTCFGFGSRSLGGFRHLAGAKFSVSEGLKLSTLALFLAHGFSPGAYGRKSSCVCGVLQFSSRKLLTLFPNAGVWTVQGCVVASPLQLAVLKSWKFCKSIQCQPSHFFGWDWYCEPSLDAHSGTQGNSWKAGGF